MTDSSLSLEIGENVVRQAIGKMQKNQFELQSLSYHAETPPFFEIDSSKIVEDEAVIIKKILGSTNSDKLDLNVIIPDTYTYSQIIQMPKLKERELMSAIRYQADQFIPMAIEDAVIDIEILFEDTASNTLLVLIVAAAQKLVAKVEKVFDIIGLYPESVENELSSVGRFLSTFFQPKDKNNGSIFINFGFNSTSLYFFYNKLNLVVDSHTFKLGLNIFSKETQANTNSDYQKSREILKSIGFSRQGSIQLDQILNPSLKAFIQELEKFSVSVKSKFKPATIENIFLFNEAGSINLFPQKVQEEISIPTQIFDLAPYIKKNAASDPYMKVLPYFFVSIGGCIQ